MRIGTIDRRVILQRKGQSYSSSGEPVDAWSNLAERWAGVKPLLGFERSTAAQWVAREQVQFTVRWSDEISTLSPLDRVIFPAADAAHSPTSVRSIYDIIAVYELGRRDAFLITAARRTA